MLKFAHIIAAPLTAIAVGTMGGFLAVGWAARAIDAYEASQCPGVTRVQVNTNTPLRDWAAWGACPRDGLIDPLKP
jgi:hypothetical protein